jgi:sugar lactone lactonase YvrE
VLHKGETAYSRSTRSTTGVHFVLVLAQLSLPNSICIDDDDGTIYIADFSNDRIVKWKSNATEGQIMAGGHRKGNQFNCLSDVIIDHC